jgi:integrase
MKRRLCKKNTFPPPPSSRKKASDHTVAELLDIYETRIVNHMIPSTKVAYLHCLKYWRRALGDTLLKNVTPALLADCQDYLRNAKGFNPATVNKYTNAVSPAFTLATSPALNWLHTNPFSQFKRLKEDPGRAPRLSHPQVRKLLEECDRIKSKHLGLFVRLALSTGGRRQEILNLRWGHINFTDKTVSFLQTKGRKPRVVPIPRRMVTFLAEVYEQRFGDDAIEDTTRVCVFPSIRDPFTPATNIHGPFNKARARAGLAGEAGLPGSAFRIHDNRHHYASRLIIDGDADILSVSILLGHSSVRQTQRYAHLTRNHNAAKVEKMGEKLPF